MTDSLISGHRPYHAARISRMPHRRELKLNFKKKLSTEPGALLVDMPEFTEHVQSCALLCGDIMQRVVANDITFLNAFKPTEPLPAFVNKNTFSLAVQIPGLLRIPPDATQQERLALESWISYALIQREHLLANAELYKAVLTQCDNKLLRLLRGDDKFVQRDNGQKLMAWLQARATGGDVTTMRRIWRDEFYAVTYNSDLNDYAAALLRAQTRMNACGPRSTARWRSPSA